MEILMANEADRWERRHRQRMLAEANKYVDILPKLVWMYFGELPMEVEPADQIGPSVVRPLSDGRDSCYTLLKRIFGGMGD